MPASVQKTIWDDLYRKLKRGLYEDWGYELRDVSEKYKNLVTPYRVVFILKDLPIITPSRTIEHRGPREDAPYKAIEGFLKRWGISYEDCIVEETKKGRFLFYHERIEGQSMAEALSKAFVTAITQLRWDKVMRFADEEAVWIRPLQRIVGVFDGKKLIGGLDCTTKSWKEKGAGDSFLEYKNTSWDDMLCLGKTDTPKEIKVRVLMLFYQLFLCKTDTPKEIQVRDIKDYKGIDIILNHDSRYEEFKKKYSDCLKAKDLLHFHGNNVSTWLRNNLYLIERGKVLTCKIENKTGELPKEVIELALLDHLKAKVFEIDDSVISFYIMIEKRRDNSQDRKLIREGYQKVAMARLADAQFFWSEDSKIKLTNRLPMLDKQTWHNKLGSVGDKARRLEKLCPEIVKILGGSDDRLIELARQAGLISRSDLSSHLVIEYPSLQGVIGSHYAKR